MAEKTPLSEEDFKYWKENHFASLQKKVNQVEESVAFIKGRLNILIPLILIIGTAIGGLYLKGL